MKTIWKYRLDVAFEQTITVPAEIIEVLKIDTQNGLPHIWFRVNTDVRPKPYTVYMYGTGAPCDRLLCEYLDTIQLDDGRLVLHVFITEGE